MTLSFVLLDTTPEKCCKGALDTFVFLANRAMETHFGNRRDGYSFPAVANANRDYQIRINGPHYSYRNPLSGRRQFVFDEELQNYYDEGLGPAKAIEQFVTKKYPKHKRNAKPVPNKTALPMLSSNPSGLLSPVTWMENNTSSPSRSNRTNEHEYPSRMIKQTTSHTYNNYKASPASDYDVNNRSPSLNAEDYDSDAESELVDEQKPLVSVGNKRKWQLKLESDDNFNNEAVENRHGAFSIMCMKDDLQRYIAACKQFDVNPSQTFIDQLGAKTVRMKYHTLSPIELGPILHVLAERATAPITALDLSCNPLSEKAAGLLVAFLNTSAADCIAYLNLSDCALGLRGGQQILDVLQDNLSIKELYLSSNNFGDGIGPFLQNLLSSNEVLNHLDISDNGLAVDSAERLSDGISKNTTLVSCNFSWNGIRMKGGEAIGSAILVSTLAEIDLSWNGLSNDGARALSTSLAERNCALKVLNLESNRVGLLGAYALGRALRHNRVLKKLDLTLNPITTEGVKALLKGLMNNYQSAVEQLDIRDVPIEQAFTEMIEQIRRRKTKRNRPDFTVNYGHPVHDPDFYTNPGDAFNRVNDPVSILFQYIKENGLRLMDLFAQFDKDHSSSLSADEFRKGFVTAKIPLTESQLTYLFGLLDVDGDGEVEYGELLLMQQHHRENMRRKYRMAKREETTHPKTESTKPDSRSLPKINTAKQLPNKHDSDGKAKKSKGKNIKGANRDYLVLPQQQVHNDYSAESGGSTYVKLNERRKAAKLPEIGQTSNHGNGSRRRVLTFKEALDAERKKLFSSIKTQLYVPRYNNQNPFQKQQHQPPVIQPDQPLQAVQSKFHQNRWPNTFSNASELDYLDDGD